jgi:hypothetical protein
MLMNIKTDRKIVRLYILLAIVLISIVSLSILTLFLYNFYGRREFSTYDSFQVNYSSGTGGLNLDFTITPGPFGCMGYVNFETYSIGDVDVIGITFVLSRVYKDGVFTTYADFNPIHPFPSYQSVTTIGIVNQNNNITAEGRVRVQYLVDSVIEEEIFYFKSTIIAPLDITGSTYSQLLPLIWVEFLILLIIVALLISPFYIIKRIKAYKRYSRELKTKDEEFFEYLEEFRQNL